MLNCSPWPTTNWVRSPNGTDDAVATLLSAHSFGDAALAGWTGKELGDMADAIIGGQGGSGDDDPRAAIDSSFAVVVNCPTEKDQIRVIEWCNEMDLKCRALI